MERAEKERIKALNAPPPQTFRDQVEKFVMLAGAAFITLLFSQYVLPAVQGYLVGGGGEGKAEL